MRWRRVVYGRRRRRRRSSSGGGGFLVLAVLAFGLLSYAASYVGWVAVIAALVVATVLVVWFLVRRATLSTPKAQNLSLGLQNVGAMSGGQFEVFMAQVLKALGYSTTVLGGSGDQGVDIIAVARDGKVAVQCKNYKKRVGNKPVQEVYAGSRHHRCDHAWMVAPAGYTKGAHELAQSVGVLLFDVNSIRKWIKSIDEAEKQAMEERQST
jgi:restriction system protein